jgi:hypothetical protein
MKKSFAYLLLVSMLVFASGMAWLDLRVERVRQLTFAECEQFGGQAWRVDLYDPDICPECTDYAACEAEYSDRQVYPDLREVCPQVEDCGACMSENFPYPETCPRGKEKLGQISDAAIWFMCCR